MRFHLTNCRCLHRTGVVCLVTRARCAVEPLVALQILPRTMGMVTEDQTRIIHFRTEPGEQAIKQN